MTENTWLTVSPARFFFGFRAPPGDVPDWESTLRRKVGISLKLAPDAGLLEGHDYVGRYQLNSTAEVAGARDDAADWRGPHPCPGVGQPLGFIIIRWRQTLSVPDRARLGERICSDLQGFVLREGTRARLDPLRFGELDFDMFTSKYGRFDFLVTDHREYLQYV